MVNYLQRFKAASKRKPSNDDTFGSDTLPSGDAKWYDVRLWKIGEWGSLASIIGIGLWASDKYGFKRRLEHQADLLAAKIKPSRKRKAKK